VMSASAIVQGSFGARSGARRKPSDFSELGISRAGARGSRRPLSVTMQVNGGGQAGARGQLSDAATSTD
jgi:hypothetical protein